MEDSTKILTIDFSQKPNSKSKKKEKNPENTIKIQEKEKKKRVITEHKLWNFTEEELSFENQWQELNKPEDIINRWLRSQIKSKIYGYLGQDVEKRAKNPDKIVDPVDAIQINLSNILQKLVDSNLDCFYCREKVRILYEFVRDPKQWTLERIDNKQGHHLGNVEIACLQCNLRRRTMYHERYVFTKQMTIQKIG